jgi:hypothetical protein
LNAGRAGIPEVELVGVVVVLVLLDDAALAMAEPPSASAARAAIPASTFLPCLNIG